MNLGHSKTVLFSPCSWRLTARVAQLLSLFALLATFWNLSSASPVSVAHAGPSQAPGTLTVKLFQDIDVDATADGVEPGVSGITVRLYDATGACATKTSTADGRVSFASADTAGCASDKVRMEVDTSTFPSGLLVGPVNLNDDDGNPNTPTTTDAATDASAVTQILLLAADVTLNISLINPTSYTCSPENAFAMTTCFVNGDSQPSTSPSHNMDALVGFPYTASGAAFPGTVMAYVEPSHLATMGEIGSTWGLAWSQQTEQVYVGSFLKRHIALGPLGLDGIYRVDLSSGTPAVENWLNLTGQLGIDVGESIVPSEASRNLPTGLVEPSRDSAIFPLIGLAGLGDVDLVTDEALDPGALKGDGWIDREFLFVVNLYSRSVHVIDPTTSRLLLTYPIPAPNPTCTNGTHRPWAVDYRDGSMYVGIVCDGSNESAAVKDALTVNSNLEAIVYQYNLLPDLGAATIPSAPTVTPQTILRFSLDYEKGIVWYGGDCRTHSNWHPWRDNVSPGTFTTSGPAKCWPTPILADIDFSDDGNMLLAMMDRSSHQWGFKNYSPDSSDPYGLYQGMSGGDMLMACPDGNGVYILENNATCGSLTSKNSLARNDGPGGKEFFYGDGWTRQQNGGHQETANNGIAVLPGANEVIAAGMDPYGNAYHSAGGINWYSTKDGTPRDPGYMLYASKDSNSPVDILGTAGKSGGLGDVDLICPQMPVTIGDYVWVDSDQDGIQDADELPLANVTVYLSLPNGSIVSTVTDAYGRYHFTASRFQRYQIGFDTATSTTALPNGISPADLIPTIANSPGSNDGNDSDLTETLTVAGKALPALSLETSKNGMSNHTGDAGFIIPSGTFMGKSWDDKDRDGIQDPNEPPQISIIVELVDPNGRTVGSVRTATDGTYSFANVLIGEYTIEFSTPSEGWWFTLQDQGNDDTKDSDVEPTTGRSTPIQLAIGATQIVDAGFVQMQIGDKVWHDADGDGIQDQNEVGLANVTVELVSPGTWTFCANENATCQFSGTTTVRYGKNGIFAYKLASETIQCTSQLFGDPLAGTLKECQYLDVREQATPVIASTTTDSSGLYYFDSRNVPDGIQANTSYILRIPLSDGNLLGYSLTRMNVDSEPGTSDALDSDATREGGYALIRIATGNAERINHTFDFGFGAFTGKISGEAWNDLDGTGIQKLTLQDLVIPLADEVPVNLINIRGDIAAKMETDAGGQYTFDGLPNDTYLLEFEPPVASVWFTLMDQGTDEALDSDVSSIDGRTDPIVIGNATFMENVDAGLIRGATAYAPRLPSPGDIANPLGEPVYLFLEAIDATSDQLIYEATNLPPGLQIGRESGHITGSPTGVGTYEVIVTAKNGNGGVTRITFLWTITQTPIINCAGLTQEAEHALLKGRFARVVDGSEGASNGHYIMVPDQTGNEWNGASDAHVALFCMNVETAGTYRIHGNLLSALDDNSFYVTVDGSPAYGYIWHTDIVPVFTEAYVKHNRAADPVVVTLSAGQHTIGIHLREDGTKIDNLTLELIEASAPEPTCAGMAQEAEAGILRGRFQTFSDAAASGGMAIQVMDGSGSNFNGANEQDSVEYCFNVPAAGRYLLQGVHQSPNGNADSFYVKVNALPSTGYLWDTTLSPDAYVTTALNNRGGANPLILDLSGGIHRVTLILREDGTKLDKLSLVEAPIVSVAAVAEPLEEITPQNGRESGLAGILIVPSTHKSEPIIENIIVNVLGAGDFQAQATTDAYGRYFVDDVPAGEYTVQIALPMVSGESQPVEQALTVSALGIAEMATAFTPSVENNSQIFIPVIRSRSLFAKDGFNGSSNGYEVIAACSFGLGEVTILSINTQIGSTEQDVFCLVR